MLRRKTRSEEAKALAALAAEIRRRGCRATVQHKLLPPVLVVRRWRTDTRVTVACGSYWWQPGGPIGPVTCPARAADIIVAGIDALVAVTTGNP